MPKVRTERPTTWQTWIQLLRGEWQNGRCGRGPEPLKSVAQTLEKQVELSEAAAFFERAAEIAERLAKLDPTNARCQDDAKKSRAAVERIQSALKEK